MLPDILKTNKERVSTSSPAPGSAFYFGAIAEREWIAGSNNSLRQFHHEVCFLLYSSASSYAPYSGALAPALSRNSSFRARGCPTSSPRVRSKPPASLGSPLWFLLFAPSVAPARFLMRRSSRRACAGHVPPSFSSLSLGPTETATPSFTARGAHQYAHSALIFAEFLSKTPSKFPPNLTNQATLT
ncbi:hypothetical protein WwAna0546 [Wolbachia endosymbiont of Drosophila ananassae]|nr:hypothetical protein WwAna0546 [Wolbachia endosymbiont of Drosophila ananassae]